ncbi:MAG: hypothetical protein ACRDTE_10855 [Pseudonocardiaceae bacterium]
MFVDHSFVRLRDGSLFCVAGNDHTDTEILGCLYYVSRRDALRYLGGPSNVVGATGEGHVKIGPLVKKHPARYRALLATHGIRCWESTHLQAVCKSEVAEYYEPRERLTVVLDAPHHHQCAQHTLRRVVDEACRNGIAREAIGLTGSACFDDSRLCRARDIDLVLFERTGIRGFCAASRAVFSPLNALAESDARRIDYLSGRFTAQELSTATARRMLGRRYDVGWSAGVQIDLTEVRADSRSIPRWVFDEPALENAEIRGTVSNIGAGYPISLEIKGWAGDIYISCRGWQGVLLPGDLVHLRGTVFGTAPPMLVVDEQPGHWLYLG